MTAFRRLNPDLCRRLEGIIGWPIREVHCGRNTGSHISVILGGVSLVRPAGDGESHSRLDASVTIFVENASWRLSDQTRVVCSWRSDNNPGREMENGLRLLVGSRVKLAEVSAPTGDLRMVMANGLLLEVFSDCMSLEEDGDNYSILGLGSDFTIAPGGAVSEIAPLK
jgi:hypothetical protein